MATERQPGCATALGSLTYGLRKRMVEGDMHER
jgi:hypothetical protein